MADLHHVGGRGRHPANILMLHLCSFRFGDPRRNQTAPHFALMKSIGHPGAEDLDILLPQVRVGTTVGERGHKTHNALRRLCSLRGKRLESWNGRLSMVRPWFLILRALP